MSYTYTLALAVAALSLILSTYALLDNLKLRKRVIALEVSREQKENPQVRKASLVASLATKEVSKIGGAIQFSRYQLKVRNLGAIEAKDVRVIVNGQPLLEVPYVEPRADIDFYIDKSAELAPQFNVFVSWSDKFGTQETYTGVTQLD